MDLWAKTAVLCLAVHREAHSQLAHRSPVTDRSLGGSFCACVGPSKLAWALSQSLVANLNKAYLCQVCQLHYLPACQFSFQTLIRRTGKPILRDSMRCFR